MALYQTSSLDLSVQRKHKLLHYIHFIITIIIYTTTSTENPVPYNHPQHDLHYFNPLYKPNINYTRYDTLTINQKCPTYTARIPDHMINIHNSPNRPNITLYKLFFPDPPKRNQTIVPNFNPSFSLSKEKSSTQFQRISDQSIIYFPLFNLTFPPHLSLIYSNPRTIQRSEYLKKIPTYIKYLHQRPIKKTYSPTIYIKQTLNTKKKFLRCQTRRPELIILHTIPRSPGQNK